MTILGTDPEVQLAAAGPGPTETNPGLRVRLHARLAIELAYDADPGPRDARPRGAELARRAGDPAVASPPR